MFGMDPSQLGGYSGFGDTPELAAWKKHQEELRNQPGSNYNRRRNARLSEIAAANQAGARERQRAFEERQRAALAAQQPTTQPYLAPQPQPQPQISQAPQQPTQPAVNPYQLPQQKQQQPQFATAQPPQNRSAFMTNQGSPFGQKQSQFSGNVNPYQTKKNGFGQQPNSQWGY